MKTRITYHVSRIKQTARLLRVKCYVLRDQSGQTIIETVIGIFFLTSAMVVGLGLAIYAFATTTSSQNKVIASGLAREGVEVARMMRDSNWLRADTDGSSANNIRACSDIGDKQCFPQAYTGPTYNLANGNQRFVFNNTTGAWTISAGASNYNLYLQPNGAYTHAINGTSTFARKIVISRNSASPYTNSNSNQELIIQSIVGWRGKRCTAMTNQDPSTTNCRITVEEHLTNWKDYQ